MTTQEKIAIILKDDYQNFGGRLMVGVGCIHKNMRRTIGDEKYLEFIEKQQKENPRPVYKVPSFLKPEEAEDE